eukprot:TRINITY_DN11530_c0_g1_i1.p1 TRINITY_DN11530_c0_g1~~TRINITY_DN11530_c0_g1_i1.p1  ORF type:complete len:477 (+),score=89.23 TRINITY_DN11530_c0_g1_i1:7-1437(+)
MNDRKLQQYSVSSTDTLVGIAVKFNMTVGALKKINKLHSNDVFPGRTILVYEVDDKSKKALKEEIKSTSSINRLTKPKVRIPTLVSLRRRFARHYIISEIQAIDSTFASESSGTSGFNNTIPDALKEDENKVYQERARFVVHQCSVPGSLTVTPERIIFEPGLEETEVKEFGIFSCQFACVNDDVVDLRVLTLSLVERELLNIGVSHRTDPINSKFLQVTITAKPSSVKYRDQREVIGDGYHVLHFIINEVDIPNLSEKLLRSFSEEVFHPNADQLRDKRQRYGPAYVDRFENDSDSESSEEELPNIIGKSSILNEESIRILQRYLPPIEQLKDWELLFTTAQHGISMQTFYNRTREISPTLLIISDSNGGVFGGYCTEPWEQRSGFYGTGQCFLFTLEPRQDACNYNWAGKDSFFMYSTNEVIAMGGGSSRGVFGLWIGDNFSTGHSFPCTTFGNERLSTTSNFECVIVEVWALV